MPKTLIIISKEPQIKNLCDQLDHRNKFLDKKLNEIKKQAEKAAKDSMDGDKKIWDQIIEELKASNNLPKDFSKEKHYIGYNTDEDRLFMGSLEEKNTHPLEKIFGKGVFINLPPQ